MWHGACSFEGHSGDSFLKALASILILMIFSFWLSACGDDSGGATAALSATEFDFSGDWVLVSVNDQVVETNNSALLHVSLSKTSISWTQSGSSYDCSGAMKAHAENGNLKLDASGASGSGCFVMFIKSSNQIKIEGDLSEGMPVRAEADFLALESKTSGDIYRFSRLVQGI